MSSHDGKATWPAKLGLGLALITTAILLVILGMFGVNLLGALLVPPDQPVAAAPATPAAPAAAAPASQTSVAEKAPAAPAPPDPAVAALLKTGAEVYIGCSACHGPQGKAVVANMAPNLAGSAYVNGPSERLAMIVLNGIQYPGPYLGQMISWKAQFTDEQIAGVLTYIRSNFGNSAPPVTVDQIKGARLKHGPRDTPFSRAELDKVTTNL
jgi:mono/diheme cytochrome c family protein